MVKLALLQEDTKVLEDGGEATRGSRCLLEGLDDSSSPEDPLQKAVRHGEPFQEKRDVPEES